MNKGIYILFFILTISFVSATTGGEKVTIFEEPNCVEDIRVEVLAEQPIDFGEYWLVNCTDLGLEQWLCDCPKVEMQTQLNTLNNYSFELVYAYQEEQPTQQSSGGGSRVRRYYYYINNTDVIQKEILPDSQEPEQDDLDGDMEQDNDNNDDILDSVGDLNPVDTNIGTDEGSQEKEQKTQKKISHWVLVGLLFVCFISLILFSYNMYKIYWKE